MQHRFNLRRKQVHIYFRGIDCSGGARIPSPVPDRRARGEPLSFHQAQDLGAAVRLLGQCRQETDSAGLNLAGVSPLAPWRVSSGQQGATTPPLPIERKRPAQWQAFAIIVAPGTDAERGAE